LLHVYQDIPGIGFWVKKNCGPALMGNKKKNPALMVIEKNIPAPIWSEKKKLAQIKNPGPPLEVEWSLPYSLYPATRL